MANVLSKMANVTEMANVTKVDGYGEDTNFEIDMEKYDKFLRELDIPKIILDLAFCALVVIAIVATMIRKCMKKREEAAQDRGPRRVRFTRANERNIEIGSFRGSLGRGSIGRGILVNGTMRH